VSLETADCRLELQVGATAIPYEVRRSSQTKRTRIVVTPEGVEVVVPAGTALNGADGLLAYLDHKRRWAVDARFVQPPLSLGRDVDDQLLYMPGAQARAPLEEHPTLTLWVRAVERKHVNLRVEAQ
jgi:hypothetical protein